MKPSITGVAWDDLAVLLAAFDHQSLNRAAAALQIGQSTASRRLHRLETDLGARLFDRTPEGLQPTALALDLLPHARLIEGHMADITRLAAGMESEPEGRVRLAMPDGFASEWMMPRLHGFFERWPRVDIDFVIGHAVVDLIRREADVAVRFIRPTSPDLILKTLGHLPMGAFATPEVARQPLDQLRWIQFDDPDGRFSETRWVDTHIQPTRTMRVSVWNALFSAAKQGLGAAVLAPMVADAAGLVPVASHLPPPPSREVYLVVHRALRHVPRIRALLDWITEVGEASLRDLPPATGTAAP